MSCAGDPANIRRLGSVSASAWLAANWLLERWNLGPLSLIFRDQWLTFTYVSVALILLAHWPRLIERLRWVANAGRMALTNYLIQIAALDLLFSGYAIGLGRVRPVTGFALALLCFAGEVVFSTVWLARFQFGLAEWLWRALATAAGHRSAARSRLSQCDSGSERQSFGSAERPRACAA